MSVQRFESGSAANGELAKGCQYCIRGSKMVLLVTGRCSAGCFYCPISNEKKGRDVVYANEGRAHSDEDIIREAESMDAEGTGITGGDPSAVMDRTVHYIELLKAQFGRGHHIHMYTAVISLENAKRTGWWCPCPRAAPAWSRPPWTWASRCPPSPGRRRSSSG